MANLLQHSRTMLLQAKIPYRCPSQLLMQLGKEYTAMANDNEVIDVVENKAIFTKRDGTVVEVQDFVVTAAEMTSVLRLKEDFEQRGEYLSIKGVMLHILDKGITSTRHYWNAADQNKNRRDFAKSAASLFNSDGSIRDAEGLAKLAIAKGLVKGTPRQV